MAFIVNFSLFILLLPFSTLSATALSMNYENEEFSYRIKRQGQPQPPLNFDPYYVGCGVDRGCIPENCIEYRNCSRYLVTWKLQDKPSEYMEVQVLAHRITDSQTNSTCNDPTSRRYIALGFSSESKKSKLAVIECSKSQSSADELVLAGWSSSTNYNTWDRNCTINTQTGQLKKCSVELDMNENMICQFNIKKRIIFKQEIYDFEDSEYFIHVTSGCNMSELKIGMRKGGRLFTTNVLIHFDKMKQLTDIALRSDPAKWHGVLMTIAWGLLIPTGIFFARYFKETCVSISIWKYRLWFAVHVSVVLSAFVVMGTATIVMMQERSEVRFAWPTKPSSILHFKLGFAASFLFIVQVSTGWIRFGGRKARRGFAFFHFLNGITSHIIAMICIGTSFELGMPCNVLNYTIALTMWIMICHGTMTIHFYKLDEHLGLFYHRALYPFPIPPVTYDEMSGRKIRISITIAFLIGTMIICAVIIIDYLVNKECMCKRTFCKDSGNTP